MATTLKIKNESGAKLDIATPGGVVQFEANQIKELPEKQLTGPGMAEAVLFGKVSIQTAGDPTDDQIALARTVLPPLVTGAGAKTTQLKGRFDLSQKELLKLRTAFNKTWKSAEAGLGAAQAATEGWPSLRKAVKALILDHEKVSQEVKEHKEAVKALEDKLAQLKGENLADTGRTLEEWYADRLATEKQLDEAKAALAKVNKEKSNPLIAEVDTVESGIAKIQAINKNKAIGKEIPEFGQ